MDGKGGSGGGKRQGSSPQRLGSAGKRRGGHSGGEVAAAGQPPELFTGGGYIRSVCDVSLDVTRQRLAAAAPTSNASSRSGPFAYASKIAGGRGAVGSATGQQQKGKAATAGGSGNSSGTPFPHHQQQRRINNNTHSSSNGGGGTLLETTTLEALDAAVECAGARHLSAPSNRWPSVHAAKEENLRLRTSQRMVGLSLKQQLQEAQRQHGTATGYTERHAAVNGRRLEAMEQTFTANYEQFLINTNKREVAKHCHIARLANARTTQWLPAAVLAVTSQAMLRAVVVARAKETLRRLFLGRALAYVRRKKAQRRRQIQLRAREEAMTERPPNHLLRSAIPFAFGSLPEALITRIVEEGLQKKCFLPAEFISYAGEPGDSCFILLNGVVQCTSLTSDAAAAIMRGGGGGATGGSAKQQQQQQQQQLLAMMGGTGGGGASDGLGSLPQTDLSEAAETFRPTGKTPTSGVSSLQRQWTVLCRSVLLTPEIYEHTFRACPSGPGADCWVLTHGRFTAICEAFFAESAKALKELLATAAASSAASGGGGGVDSNDMSLRSSSPSPPDTSRGGKGGKGGGGAHNNNSAAKGAANNKGRGAGADEAIGGGDCTADSSAAHQQQQQQRLYSALSAEQQQQARQCESVAAAREWLLRLVDARRELAMVRYYTLTAARLRKASALFAHWSPEGVAGIIAKARPVVRRRDDVVVRAGRYGKALLIVVAGRLEVRWGGGSAAAGGRVEHFHAGSCVADVAAAAGIRSPLTTVVAVTNADLWIVDHKDVEALAIREDQNIFMAAVLAAVDEHGNERIAARHHTNSNNAAGGGQ